jgi:hypothetical protein
MPANTRAELFAETADRKDLPDAIVEKDFWVCWVLKQLFSIEALSDRLLFNWNLLFWSCFAQIIPLFSSMATQSCNCGRKTERFRAALDSTA